MNGLGAAPQFASKLEVRVPRAYTNVVQRQTARNSASLHLRLSLCLQFKRNENVRSGSEG